MRYRHAFLALAFGHCGDRAGLSLRVGWVRTATQAIFGRLDDTSTEKNLLVCESQRGRCFVKIGATDGAGGP